MRFSIIIPTHNRPKLLDECLTAIGRLNYARTEFEVLVVDDGSNPWPAGVIAQHASILPLRYFHHHPQGPARTRNCGLRHARGQYVVFTDDDCGPQEDWLHALDDAFMQRPAAGLGGRIVAAPGTGLFGATSQLLVTFLYEYCETNAGRLRFFCSNNFACERQALLRIGGFDEAFPLAAAEDRELCARWLLHGELHYVHEAVVQHRQDLNVLSFWAQHYRYGRGAFQFWLRHKAQGYSGWRLEPGRFYRQMLTFPFATASVPRALGMSILLALSQMACATGYFVERQKRPRPR